MSAYPDLGATMPISRECWVTTFISNRFLLSMYSIILFMLLSCTTVFVLVTFSTGMNCWSSSLISPNTVFNRSQVIWCSFVSTPATLYVVELLVVWQVITHHNPGGIHKKNLCTDYTPPCELGGISFIVWTCMTQFPVRWDLMNHLRMSVLSIYYTLLHASSHGFLCQSLLSTSDDI